jgi:putative FmdB family regulatory protein
MPIYEFACNSCEHVFEKLRRLSDNAGPECPKCGSDNTDKKISGFVAKSGGSSGGSAPAPGRGFT